MRESWRRTLRIITVIDELFVILFEWRCFSLHCADMLRLWFGKQQTFCERAELTTRTLQKCDHFVNS